MKLLLAALVALSLFGLLTRKTWLGVLINLQGLFVTVVVALVVLSQQQNQVDPMALERAKGLGLILLIFSQLQALVALGFAVRMHYLRRKPRMEELGAMKH